ncbi:MAG TPA: hypothetical protein VFE65_20625 [Pseudonocardia sp.]|jgi:hypothetical protein|nr:hypothetical protein [Pseudonocardia sp.]
MAAPTSATPVWRLQNEFAAVEVELDTCANSPRLKITDLRSGTVGYLDPLELERLSAARHVDLTWIVSPANGFGSEPDD